VGFTEALGVWVESWWRRYMLKNKKTKIGKRLKIDGANIINKTAIE
jgi:hypothetical protein